MTSTPHTPSSRAQKTSRTINIGQIHAGKKALGWSDDDYRFHIKNWTGKTSSADMSAADHRNVLAHMARLGFTPKSASFKPFDQLTKIKWLWRKIGEEGGLRNPTDAGLLAFVSTAAKRPISDLRFLPTKDASNVIEALKKMLDRAKKPPKDHANA